MDLYKKTLNSIYDDFNGEMNGIMDKLNSFEFLDIKKRFIKPVAFETQSGQSKEIEYMEVETKEIFFFFLWQRKKLIFFFLIVFLAKKSLRNERHDKRCR